MLRSIEEIRGYTIRATDDTIGSVDDFYFDDERWTVRYLVVDTGGWLPGRRVLISPVAIETADWNSRTVALRVTKERVQNSPGIDADKPVSRQYEVNYFNYYGWPYYWGGVGAWGAYPYPYLLAATPPQPSKSEMEALERERRQADPHLRSVKEVTGYHIEAADDDIGHAEDFVVDDESWELRYLVVDTSNWWFGKQVLVDPRWATSVRWPDRKVFVDLTKEQIKNAPAWDPSAPINRAYEERLYDAYGRPAYWV